MFNVFKFFTRFKEETNKNDDANKTLIGQIIMENYDQYYRLAYSYVHHAEDASDLVQNGACKALKSSATLRQPEYARTWVYRIMLNECFQYLRQPKYLSYETLQEENGLEAGSREDHYTDIDLQRAIDALPEKEKAIIQLKYFEDMKLEEIAQILDENVSTVKSRLYRCMKKLRSGLSDGEESGKPAQNKQDRQVMI